MPKARRLLKIPNPLPCKFCGSLPVTSSRIGFLGRRIHIECSNNECNKEHQEYRHFTPRATEREALNSWNQTNARRS